MLTKFICSNNNKFFNLLQFQEIAEPLMDLKQGMETLKANKTFKAILGTLLSIGIFLNGNEVSVFYLFVY